MNRGTGNTISNMSWEWEKGETFSWQNLVWLSDTNARDDTHGMRCHMVVRIGTWMMLIAMVYSAVIVVMMKIVHNDGTIY